MTIQIRITAAPPSNVAPDEIREAWVGIEMPAIRDEPDGGGGAGWVGDSNVGGYLVKGVDAMQALVNAGKTEAFDFWNDLPPIEQLCFGADFCEAVSE